MKILKTSLILFLLVLSTESFSQISSDTITHWKLKKDKKLLVDGSELDSYYILKLKEKTKYKQIYFQAFNESEIVNPKQKKRLILRDDKTGKVHLEADFEGSYPDGLNLTKSEIDSAFKSLKDKKLTMYYFDVNHQKGLKICDFHQL